MSAQGDWCNQKEDLVGLLREMQINADVIYTQSFTLKFPAEFCWLRCFVAGCTAETEPMLSSQKYDSI